MRINVQTWDYVYEQSFKTNRFLECQSKEWGITFNNRKSFIYLLFHAFFSGDRILFKDIYYVKLLLKNLKTFHYMRKVVWIVKNLQQIVQLVIRFVRKLSHNVVYLCTDQ